MVLEKRINSVENETQLLLTTYGLDVLGVIVILAPAGSSPVGGPGPPCGGGLGQLDGRDPEAVDSFAISPSSPPSSRCSTSLAWKPPSVIAVLGSASLAIG